MDDVTSLLSRLSLSQSSVAALDASGDIVKAAKRDVAVLLPVVAELERQARNKKIARERENAMVALLAILKDVGQPALPFTLPLLPLLLDMYSDKSKQIADGALAATKQLILLTLPQTTATILPLLYEIIRSPSYKAPSKLVALQLLARLAKTAPNQVAARLPDLIENVQHPLHEIDQKVSKEAVKTMTALCSVVGNQDIQPHIETLVSCMQHPGELPAAIEKLAMTTFVAEVTAPALAIMVPLLTRALNERSASLLRPTTIIVDNLFKLVRNPDEAAPFLPLIAPGVDRVVETAAFPEIRALGTAAQATIRKIKADAAATGGGGAAANGIANGDANGDAETNGHHHDAHGPPLPAPAEIKSTILTLLASNPDIAALSDSSKAALDVTLGLVSAHAYELLSTGIFNKKDWTHAMAPFVAPYVPSAGSGETVAVDVWKHYDDIDRNSRPPDYQDDDADGELLCDIDFSLAYGTMLLLNNTKLKLRRGRRYGLCGPNGAGKSTLMRSIAGGKVEGFPTQDQVRTVFVQHKLQGDEGEKNVVDFIAEDPLMKKVKRDHIIAELEKSGFDEEQRTKTVGGLSGGWKMKLELCRAMLSKADLLLLDEPTNHLDVASIAFLESWLLSQPHMTVLVVSHDAGFLEHVTTDILHYERNKKLKHYRGNIAEFVKQRPEAKTYYTLSNSNVEFKFPPPGFLTGVRSQTRSILRMTNCSFTYPGASKKQLENVTVALSLSSRVAIIGPNGAGKSTLVKVLTGELVPQEGEVNKHPNLRIGYIAQHSLHHVNRHLTDTPLKYMLWRFGNGDDKEVLEKQSRKLSVEERELMETPLEVRPGDLRKIESLVGRSKQKKSFQYEIKWVGLEDKDNTWVTRERLVERGFTKLVQSFDDFVAAREGLGYRELTTPALRQHFEDVGLPGDIAQYNKIGSLSDGQKVKVVIAAALWANPQILIMDEPTNYLDRDSLGGLAVAIRHWTGAVLMISHNTEFVSALCPETWLVENGRIQTKGKSAVDDSAFEDGSGSDSIEQLKTAVEKRGPKKKRLTRNELKEREVRRRLRHIQWLASGKMGEKPEDTDSD
ncbi:hypothetical protein M427DRAFT_36950 [Gonapodya prolifera JEL478]|uniref:P-loop containing nucleoside triphosphate hydrolase protein n=1 Tax=Gonapodya prolifera (strain JEL478) TaxID=1344416 RepID=A0A139A1F6_GONPJ|nr:hypothetical protein M427DRAFT_36950 [Gonapodya prolifera JEL478]|eukprot:KXS10571.1 hypothetical protein M427DRAFT_36950 [Gonapodya prolifera JEL478]